MFIEQSQESGPRALRDFISKIVLWISSLVGTLHNSSFSSSKMHILIRFSKFLGIFGQLNRYRALKFLLKYSWMSTLSLIQDSSSNLISCIQFLLHLIRVDKWKNLVFLSSSQSRSSFDFYFHFRSSLASYSSSSKDNEASSSKFSLVGSKFWIIAIFFSISLIISLEFPKLLLFHPFSSLFNLILTIMSRVKKVPNDRD